MTNKEDDFTALFTAPVNNSVNERYSTILLPFINDRFPAHEVKYLVKEMAVTMSSADERDFAK